MTIAGSQRTRVAAIGGSRRTTVTVLLCFLAAMFEGVDLQSMAIAARQLIPALGLSPAQFGAAASMSLAGLLVGAIVGGRASDRFGRKAILVIALALLGLFSLLTAAVGSFGQLLGLRLLVGLGLGGAFPTLIALVSDAAGERKALPLSLMYAGMPVGTIIATLLVLVAGPAFEWRWVFYLGGFGPLLLVPALLRWLPAARPVQPAAPGAVRLMPTRHALFGDGRAAPTMLLWVAFFFTLLVIYLLLNWVNQLMTARGFSPVQATIVLLAFGIGSMVGSVVLGAAMDSRHRRLAVIVTYAGVALSLAGLALLHRFGLLVVAGLGAGFFSVGAQLVNYALAPRFYPPAIRGTGVGWSVAIGRVGSFFGPLLGGVLLDAGLSASSVLLLFIPGLAIAAIGSTALLRTDRTTAV